MSSMRTTSQPPRRRKPPSSFATEQDTLLSTIPPIQCQEPLRSRIGFTLIVVITIITLAGTAIWILNSLHVIHVFWGDIIGAVLSAIGIFLALWPLYAQLNERNAYHTTAEDDLLCFVRGRRLFWGGTKTGTLQIRVKKQLRHTTVALYAGFNQTYRQPLASANIVEQHVGNEVMYLATFPLVEPGNYTVASQNKEFVTNVTIYVGFTTRIDWR